MPDPTSPSAPSTSLREAAPSTSLREARPSTSLRGEDKGLPTLATELWELIVSYVKQETLEPLKGLGKFLGWGLAGAIVTAFGVVLLALAGLRVIQTETSFSGHLSWLPYLIVIAAAGFIAALAARAVTKPSRKKER